MYMWQSVMVFTLIILCSYAKLSKSLHLLKSWFTMRSEVNCYTGNNKHHLSLRARLLLFSNDEWNCSFRIVESCCCWVAEDESDWATSPVDWLASSRVRRTSRACSKGVFEIMSGCASSFTSSAIVQICVNGWLNASLAIYEWNHSLHVLPPQIFRLTMQRFTWQKEHLEDALYACRGWSSFGKLPFFISPSQAIQ